MRLRSASERTPARSNSEQTRSSADGRGPRPRTVDALLALAIVVVVVCVTLASPLRHISGDTAPARAGATLLRCAGTLDLSRVEWVAKRPSYWVDAAQHSVFGPLPALVGSLALPTIADGDVIEDSLVRTRERWMSSLLVGIAAALLFVALRSRCSRRVALLASIVTAASFAGTATLAQGLWQQTVALPLLGAALASLAWTERVRRCALLVPALACMAVLVRPALAPLAVGFAVAWFAQRPRLRELLVAALLALLACAPLLALGALLGSGALPSGQLAANARVSEHVFSLAPEQLVGGLAGLLVSPGRGLVWFAPLAVIGCVLARGWARGLVIGCALQIGVFAAFHMWWGGICFGPRFLAEVTWIGCALAALHLPARRSVVALAALWTLGVGQLGTWGWRAEAWESRRNPDIDQSALWDVRDNPLSALLVRDIAAELFAADSRAPLRVRCENGRLR